MLQHGWTSKVCYGKKKKPDTKDHALTVWLLNDAKAETPVLWPPHVKSWLIGKDRDAGRDWGQEEKGMTEDEMAGWNHWLSGRESEWTPGVGDGQGGLACCSSWGRKESDTTEWLNWTELMSMSLFLFANKIICTIFSESTYICFSLADLPLLKIDPRSIISPQMTQFHSFLVVLLLSF